jgi:thymidylate synthase (FAD)
VEACGRAAGICYDKEEKEDYGSFVKRIVNRGHESVLEHAVFSFRIEGVSRALTHQLVRHRIASYSQRSQRYVDEGEFDYITPPAIKDNENAEKIFKDIMLKSEEAYKELRGMEIHKQDARYVLPNAVETKIIVTMNARSLRNFLSLRMKKDAQWEIRDLACRMYDLVHELAPQIFGDLKELRESNLERERGEGIME